VEKFCRIRQARDDNIIRRMRNVRWINKAGDTHSKYSILLAFPPQKLLRERAAMLRYMYIARLVFPKQQ
jgi:hypothetical protein